MGGRGGGGGGSKSAGGAGAIRAAYAKAAGPDGRWVSLADVRDRLGGMSRAEQDAALKKLSRQSGVHFTPENDQSALTSRDRAAALSFGGQPNHRILIDR